MLTILKRGEKSSRKEIGHWNLANILQATATDLVTPAYPLFLALFVVVEQLLAFLLLVGILLLAFQASLGCLRARGGPLRF